jgi:hypothetical protein
MNRIAAYSGSVDGVMKTWHAIKACPTEVVDMCETDFLYILRVLCRNNAYPQLRDILNDMSMVLTTVGPEALDLLREYFSGWLGASALQKRQVSASAGPVSSEYWDVSDVTVDEQVRAM